MANIEIDENASTAPAAAVTADVVIGIAGPANGEELRRRAADVAQQWPSSLNARVAVAYPVTNAAESAGERIAGVEFIPYPLAQTALFPIPWLGSGAAYRAVQEVAGRLNARTCVLLGADLAGMEGQAIEALARPVLEERVELAMPLYSISKYEGLLNSAILYPFTRAVYGRRVRYPLAPDFGISTRLMARLGVEHIHGAQAAQGQAIQWPATGSALAGNPIGQVHVKMRHTAQNDGLDLSTVLSLLVGGLFADVENNAAFWQRVRGSQQVTSWGVAAVPPPDSDGVDVRPMIESFTLASRNLQEVWGLVLPPVTLLDLKRMARLTPEQFRMPDALWAKIVYDFALAYRLRTISRAHLLGALTPLYLGWVASHAMEIRTMSAAAAEQRVEQLAKAYEDEKPYLVSRWRWPDRFNP